MPPRRSTAGRGPLLVLLLAGVAALGLGACGRRGQPEPPQSSSAKPAAAAKPASPAASRPAAGTADASPTTLATRPQALVENSDDEADTDDAAAVSPQPTPGPTSRRRPPFEVPKQPFILDPLL